MRSARFALPACALAAAAAAACKPEPVQLDANPITWWQPTPGEAANWDIQLAEEPVDLSTPRAMYVIDLFDAVPAGVTLDYGDGAPLAIPAGRNAEAISSLKARAPAPIVVCHVSTGAIRLDDPDAAKFPGGVASAPDRPAAPAPGSVVGWSTSAAAPGERFLDLREAARATVQPLIAKRLELAQQIGCDAVATNYNDTLAYNESDGAIGHGFGTVSIAEYVTWLTWIADRAHALALSVGIRNGISVNGDEPAARFDWLLVERCAEYFDCAPTRPFIARNKAVFAIEYDKDESGCTQNPVDLCATLDVAQIFDGIVKSAALSSQVHMRCPGTAVQPMCLAPKLRAPGAPRARPTARR